MAYSLPMDLLKRLADGIAAQFGDCCEVAIHDLANPEHTLIYIVNGHVSGRKTGDGPSEVVLRALEQNQPKDETAYNMRTKNGRVLRCTTVFLRDSKQKIRGIFSINFDITDFINAQNALSTFTVLNDRIKKTDAPTLVTNSVEDLLEELIRCAVKETDSHNPPAAMTREEKIRALKFMADRGALLITGAGDRISDTFAISKFTMYNYLDAAKNADKKS